MLWLELSGANAVTTQKSERGGGMSPEVGWRYQVVEFWVKSLHRWALSKLTC